MDVQTNLSHHYEELQEVSIEVQQRLEAKISKTVKLHSPVKPMFLKDTTGAFPLTECDKMCSPIKPTFLEDTTPVHSH
jgi:hypothetical protein